MHSTRRVLARAGAAAIFGIVGLLALTATTAGAQGGPDAITITPDHVGPKGDVTVSGAGFAANSPVEVQINGFFAAQATANGSGAVSKLVRVPGAASAFPVRLLGRAPNGTLRSLDGAASAVDLPCVNAPCSSGGLPSTGADTTVLLVVAAAFLGGGMLAAGKGLRSPTTARVLLPLLVIVAVGAAMAPKADAQAATGTISGTIREAGTNTPLPNMCVHAIGTSAAHGGQFGEALTGANGTYSIAGLPSGVGYSVYAVDCAAEPTHDRGFTSTASLTGGGTLTADATVARGARLSGVVTVAATGAPAKFTCVLVGATAETLQGCQVATGESGAYVAALPASAFPAGSYELAFQPSEAGLAFEYSGNAHDPAAAIAVPLTLGQWTTADAALEAAGSLSGTVVDSTSGAAPTRSVCVGTWTNGVANFASGRVQDNGGFDLPSVPAGAHKVRFFDCEGSGTAYVQQYYAGKANLAAADSVTVAAGSARTGINAAMSTTGVPSAPGTTTTTAPGSTTSTAPGSTTSTAPGSSSSSSSSSSTTTVSATPLPSDGPLTTGSTSAEAGQSVLVQGDGFAPGSATKVVIYSTPIVLAQVTADAAGKVTTAVTVPTVLPSGTHTLQLQGTAPNGSARVLQATLQVTGGSATTARATPIPRTGHENLDLTAVALLSLGFGMLLVGIRRRLTA